jgi:pyruvate,water dikinase
MSNALFIRYVLAALLTATILLCEKPPHAPEPVTAVCTWDGVSALDFVNSISCRKEFDALSGPPITPTLSDVQSVKALYELSSNRIYFASSSKYQLHFDFCSQALGFTGSHSDFNQQQYSDSPLRRYYCGTVNYFRGAGIYALQFFPDDRITAEGIRTTFLAIKDSAFFGDSLYFFPNSSSLEAISATLTDIPKISEQRIYEGQRFIALNPAVAFGYLRTVDIQEIDRTPVSRHDIIVVNGLPITLPVVAGIITTVFQTPLSHINVLSHNRATPNLAYPAAASDTLLSRLSGKLVCFTVTADTFSIREASIAEADSFWAAVEPHNPVVLSSNDDTSGIVPLSQLSYQSAEFVGAKAANLAEISRLRLGTDVLPVPECAFAIPFFYYRKHLDDNGITGEIAALLADSGIKNSASVRSDRLDKLRKRIIEAPLDQSLAAEVQSECLRCSSFTEFRFRSSTNVEDIEDFNGAGLYESHSAKPDIKSISKAIKEVYASMWTLRGFEERDFFRIDQLSCVMGILVHRSFADEQANGVAITAICPGLYHQCPN